MTNTKLFLLLGTSLSLISSVSYGSHINKEALYALPEELGRVGEGVKENSSIVFARRTLSDAAIQYYLMDRHAGYHLLAMTVMFLCGSPDRASLVRG